MLRARTHEPSEIEQALGAAIERIFGEGVSDRATLCARLNERGMKDPNGDAWTEASLTQFLASLP